MQHTNCKSLGIVLAGMLALIGGSAKADTFGSGANTFTIDFVNIGNAGNGDDLGAGGGLYGSPYGGVAYEYRMGVYEIPLNAVNKARVLGLQNVFPGIWFNGIPANSNLPVNEVSWYEAAAFVNWLNTSTGHHVAYNLNGTATNLTLWSNAEAWDNDPGPSSDLNPYRYKDAFYFLPSEDEWHKAAFHKNDGVTANYWDYATGSNAPPIPIFSGTSPGSATYGNDPRGTATEVQTAGGLSPYGTMAQDGNVWEWMESAYDGINSTAFEDRTLRGGDWGNPESSLRSSTRFNVAPSTGNIFSGGFRVASISQPIPEPSATVLLFGSSGMWLLMRRRRPAL